MANTTPASNNGSKHTAQMLCCVDIGCLCYYTSRGSVQYYFQHKDTVYSDVVGSGQKSFKIDLEALRC